MPPFVRCAGVRCVTPAEGYVADVPLCGLHKQAMREAFGDVIAPQPVEVVYYLLRPDQGSIKIGTSIDVRRRYRALNHSRAPLHLVAVEPGNSMVEGRRHRQFRTLRTSGTEWFRGSPVLLDHVAALVAEHGRPHCPCGVFGGCPERVAA